MGGLISFLPLTYSVMLIASCSLAAFPFLTGFYSKDFILESSYGQFTFSGSAIYTIATIGAIFTVLYSVKILYFAFLSSANGPKISYENAHEGDNFMVFPLVVLAVFSIFFGYYTKEIFLGMGSGFFTDNSIFIHPNHEILINTEFAVPTFFKLLPFCFTILFSLFALDMLESSAKFLIDLKFTRFGYYIFGFFSQRFFIEMFYNKFIVTTVLNLGGQTTKMLDKGVIELVGPLGIEKFLIKCSKFITSQSRGIVTDYALFMVLGLVSLIVCVYSLNIKIILFILLILGGLVCNASKIENNIQPSWVNSNINSSLLSLHVLKVNMESTELLSSEIHGISENNINYIDLDTNLKCSGTGNKLSVWDTITYLPSPETLLESLKGLILEYIPFNVNEKFGCIISCISNQLTELNLIIIFTILIIPIAIWYLYLSSEYFPTVTNPYTGHRYPALHDPELLKGLRKGIPWKLSDIERWEALSQERIPGADGGIMPGRLGKPKVLPDKRIEYELDTSKVPSLPAMEPPVSFGDRMLKPNFK